MTAGHVVSLHRYPVKGLTGQALDAVELVAGEGVPGDREWAFARPDGDYRPGAGAAFPKSEFFMLARDERLAGLTTRLDRAGQRFTVEVRGHLVHEADWSGAEGRSRSADFFARVLDLPAGVRPVPATEPGRRFTDVSVVSDPMMNAVSVINLASVRALEEKVGRPVDPARFRANVYVDGLEPFSELDLVHQQFESGEMIALGPVRLTAVLNTRRCAATQVDPKTARRDLAVPALLVEHYGHSDMGVYGLVRSSGTVRVGDPAFFGGAP